MTDGPPEVADFFYPFSIQFSTLRASAGIAIFREFPYPFAAADHWQEIFAELVPQAGPSMAGNDVELVNGLTAVDSTLLPRCR